MAARNAPLFLFFFLILISPLMIPALTPANETIDFSTLPSQPARRILLSNTSNPFLLSRDSAYSFQFFDYGPTRSHRLLVVLSTLYNTTVVWIANRDRPASPNASLLFELPSRTLTLREPNGTLIWSPSVSNISTIVMNSTGNLYIVVGVGGSSSASIEWQSFDVPADVFVPGQRLRTNHTSTASLAWNDWASGYYTLRANPGGAVLYATFDAQQNMVPYSVLNYVISNTSLNGSLYSACNRTTILYNQDATGVSLEQEGTPSPQCLLEDSNSVHGINFATRIGGDGYRFLRVMPTGDINSFFLSNSSGQLALRRDNELFKGFYSTYCRLPSYCGINGLCSSVETCTCPPLFEPIDPSDPTQGCRLQTPLNCSISLQHQFQPVTGSDYYANAYLPPRQIVENPSDCTALCLQNCSCTAAFYNNETGNCHLYDQVRTMQFGSNPSVTAFLRVAYLPASDQDNGNSVFPRKVVIGVSVAAAVVLVTMVGIIAWISRRLMKARSDDDSDSEEEAFLEGLPGLPPRFSYKELYDATEGFSKQLGKGGSGAVYDGNLHIPSGIDKNSQETKLKQQQQQLVIRVAVKELTLSEYSNIAAASKRHFRAEVATLGNLSHVNLVQLKGFCAEGMHRLLIYEYMENGSLDQWIFPNSNIKAGAHVLPWEVRHRIALDTARGLAFLHEECRERVVHLDVKPQNILLDAGFRAKLADFGLSKLMERGHSQTVTAMRGTPGYMAPEWFLNLPITDRSDVFSYGMVLLELVGGRKNLNTAAQTSEEWYFPAWALRRAGSGRISEVVDKRLFAQLDGHAGVENNIAQADQGLAISASGLLKMERLINVAFWCIQEDATSRPSMTTVVLMLEEHLQVPDPPLEMAYVPRRHAQPGRRTIFNTSSGSHTSTAAISSSNYSGATLEVTSVLSPR